MDLTKSQNPDSMVLGSAKIELSTHGILKTLKIWDWQEELRFLFRRVRSM